MNRFKFPLGAVLIIGFDQAADRYIRYLIKKGDIISDSASFFSLGYICNPGVAFGITFNKLFTIVVSLLTLSLLFFYGSRKNVPQRERVALLLLVAAGSANIVDRIMYGCVADYLRVWTWPVFNVADLIIVCSAVYLICLGVFKRGDRPGG